MSKCFFVVLLSGLFLLASCSRQAVNSPPANASPPVTAGDPSGKDSVDLCELLQAPDKYEQKQVRVKGYFCDCFENGEFYPANCPVQKKVWVEGTLTKCKDADRVDAFRQAAASEPESRYGAWTFGIIALGQLTGTKGGYGQMNQYDLLFKVDCLEHAELLDHSGKRPSEMPSDEQGQLQEFEKLK